MLDAGMKVPNIARKLNRTAQAIYARLQRIYRRRAQSPSSPWATITAWAVLRELPAAGGASWRAIDDTAFGLSFLLWPPPARQGPLAYRRSDALEKRRKSIDAWSAYCEPKTSANIVQLRNFLGETVN
jgi:hypothetical protein